MYLNLGRLELIMKAILALAALVTVSCQKNLEERAIGIVERECNTLGNGAVILRNLDLPIDNKYLTLKQIRYVGNVLQAETDCYLAAYQDKVTDERRYVVQKKDFQFLNDWEFNSRFNKIYP